MLDADELEIVGTRWPLNKVCEAMGIKVYDTSLPQSFIDMCRELHHSNPYGHIVWSYDKYKYIGGPIAIDQLGAEILQLVDFKTRNW